MIVLEKKLLILVTTLITSLLRVIADILDRDRDASNSMKFSSHLRSCINLGRANNMSRMVKIYIRGDF